MVKRITTTWNIFTGLAGSIAGFFVFAEVLKVSLLTSFLLSLAILAVIFLALLIHDLIRLRLRNHAYYIKSIKWQREVTNDSGIKGKISVRIMSLQNNLNCCCVHEITKFDSSRPFRNFKVFLKNPFYRRGDIKVVPERENNHIALQMFCNPPLKKYEQVGYELEYSYQNADPARNLRELFADLKKHPRRTFPANYVSNKINGETGYLYSSIKLPYKGVKLKNFSVYTENIDNLDQKEIRRISKKNLFRIVVKSKKTILELEIKRPKLFKIYKILWLPPR